MSNNTDRNIEQNIALITGLYLDLLKQDPTRAEEAITDVLGMCDLWGCGNAIPIKMFSNMIGERRTLELLAIGEKNARDRKDAPRNTP